MGEPACRQFASEFEKCKDLDLFERGMMLPVFFNRIGIAQVSDTTGAA